MNPESFIAIVWIMCNHVTHKKVTVVWLQVFKNVTYSNNKYSMFVIWLRNPDYM